VIAETDQALAAVLKAKVIGTAPINIAFDPPSRPWIQSLKAPTVNLFMYDLRENAQRRESVYESIRDDEGKIIARRPPMQRWDLHYTVSVFAPNVIVEHKVLAAIVRYFATLDVLPVEVLPPTLAEPGYPVLVNAGAGIKRGMFLNYAGDLKAGLELTVTVPMPPPPAPPPAPPVQQQPQIQVNPVPGADPARTAAASETAPAGPPRSAPQPPASDKEKAAAATAAAEQAEAARAAVQPPLPKPIEPLNPEAIADDTASSDTASPEAGAPEAKKSAPTKPAKPADPPKEAT
jgi:hypothetical protein